MRPTNMNVLGLKIAGHDTGAAVIANGKVVAIAEERLTRQKHTNAFPSFSIDYCLDALGLTDAEVDLVVIDHTSKVHGKTSADLFLERTEKRFLHARVEMIGHHESHAAAAFFCSPFEEAAILVYDGNGDFFPVDKNVVAAETESLFRGEGTTITLIDKMLHVRSKKRFPYTSGIGILYQTLSKDYLGFGLNNEGKMMGLASYGNDSFLKMFPVERWVREHHGRLFCNSRILFKAEALTSVATRLKAHTFLRVVYWGAKIRLQNALHALKTRLVRRTSAIEPDLFEPIVMPRAARNRTTDLLPDDYYTSVAYAAQKLFEYFSIQLATRLKVITKSENLCVSGGCALNIDANRNFLTEVGFKDLFVQPASSDCGIPLGCALWGYHVILKKPRFWNMKSASLGRTYSAVEVDEALSARAAEIEWQTSARVAEETAALLSEGSIIGWFQGGSEYGPRALGNRSIICDARNPKMKDILNARVKHREMWRPFATSILAERLEEWFDLKPSTATGFMLLAAQIHASKQALVPSIVHVDGTCRMQTLTKEDNGVYWDLLHAFESKTGVPLLINTSFNLGGDPIVETPADALDTFLRTDMDYLVLENRIIKKKVASTSV